MISISGLGPTLALQVIERTKTQSIESLGRQPEHARAIEKFRAAAADVKTAADFVENADVYNLVMKAHDLEDQMFGKAMMRKILESDINDPDSLVRRMTDDRFEAIYRSMGFSDGGSRTSLTDSPLWQDEMVRKYLDATFTNTVADEDPIVGNVLEFRTRAADVTNWYDILADKEFAEVMRTALGIPQESAQIDVEKQVEMFKAKMDLEDFKDPEFLERVERTYTAIAEAQSVGPNAASSPILQLFQSDGNGFVDITLDIASLQSVGWARTYS